MAASKKTTYPKVLIIGEPFDKFSGYGITISNLFKGWPKEQLALASRANISAVGDFSVCQTYYQLGYNKKLHPFPFSLFLKAIECGVLQSTIQQPQKLPGVSNQQKGRFKKVYRFINNALNYLGIEPYVYNLKLDDDFKKWLDEFNPDVIYSHLMSVEMIRFVTRVQQFTGKPIIIHMADEWHKSLYKNSIVYKNWQKIVDRELRALFTKSKVAMSICQAMSDEYQQRYGKEFLPFHNPINLDDWLPYSKTTYQANEKFKIAYTGRLGTGNVKTIRVVANSISRLTNSGYQIELDLYTKDSGDYNQELFKDFVGVNVKKSIPHSEIPKTLPQYDLLLLPLDFDENELEYALLSMPTKMSEYMVSGTPIMVFADKRTALAKYAAENKCAMVVTEPTVDACSKAIKELYESENLRKKLGETANKLAIRDEDAIKVREKFRNAIISGV